MKKVTLSVFALSLVFLGAGCADNPDSLMKDTIKLVNDMADVLEGIKTKDDAEKAKPKLEALKKRGEEIQERGKKLKMDDLSKDKKEALEKKYKDDFEKAFRRLGAATAQAAKAGGADGSTLDIGKILGGK